MEVKKTKEKQGQTKEQGGYGGTLGSPMDFDQVKEIVSKCEVHWFRFSCHHSYYVLVGEHSEIHYVYCCEDIYRFLKPYIVKETAFENWNPRLVHVTSHGTEAKKRNDKQILFAEAFSVKTWWQNEFVKHVAQLQTPCRFPSLVCLPKMEEFLDVSQKLVGKFQKSPSYWFSQSDLELHGNAWKKCSNWREALMMTAKQVAEHSFQGMMNFQVVTQTVLEKVGKSSVFQLASTVVSATEAVVNQHTGKGIEQTMKNNIDLWKAVMNRLIVRQRIYQEATGPDALFVRALRALTNPS